MTFTATNIRSVGGDDRQKQKRWRDETARDEWAASTVAMLDQIAMRVGGDVLYFKVTDSDGDVLSDDEATKCHGK